MAKIPSRDAFPSDISNIHVSILERCGKLKLKYFNGSITAFPIIETIANDIISSILPRPIIDPFSHKYLIEMSQYVLLPLYSFIRLFVYSFDVIHTLGIYSWGIKIDVIPGRINSNRNIIDNPKPIDPPINPDIIYTAPI